MRIRCLYQQHETLFERDVTQIVIGRPKAGETPENAVVPDLDLTPDLTVSRPHARVWRDDEGAHWIEDLGSTHGTQVNGQNVQGTHRLNSGDRVRVGETMLWIGGAAPVGIGETTRPITVDFNRLDNEQDKSDNGVAVEIGRSLDAGAGLTALFPTQSTLDDNAERLSLIYELPLQFAAETRLGPLLQIIVQRLVEVTPDASRGALLLCERNGSRLLLQACFPECEPAVSRTLARRAMEECKGFIWRRGDEGYLSGSIISFGIETGMYVPLLWQGRALGAVCIDNPGRDSSFSDDDLRLLMVVAQYAAMAVANAQLQEDLHTAWTGTLEALTATLAARDFETQSHCYRTVELAVELAQSLGVQKAAMSAIARGALLHDIGKIGISDQILLKPGALTSHERDVMKTHVTLGHQMLRHIPFFEDALPIVLYHHQNFDGTGYPSGLDGAATPVGARIFHVVDMYDALTHERPYKHAWTHEQALSELSGLAGTHCDPAVVRALELLPLATIERINTLRSFSPATRELLGGN